MYQVFVTFEFLDEKKEVFYFTDVADVNIAPYLLIDMYLLFIIGTHTHTYVLLYDS